MTCPYFNQCPHYDPHRYVEGLFLWAIVSVLVLVIEVFFLGPRRRRP